MNFKSSQGLLVVLLAVVSVGTTALVTITVMSHRVHDQPLQGQSQGSDIQISLPGFSLIQQDGQGFGSQELKGKVWIGDFIFTRCAGPCPMMTSQMAKLQAGLSQRDDWDQIRLVSFSVDPTHDTPQVLSNYAKMAQAQKGQWVFLTGARDQMWRLVRDGFKLPVFDNTDDTGMLIAHSQKFVLVDRQGSIRGYYDVLEPGGHDVLLRDLDRVLSEPLGDLAEGESGGEASGGQASPGGR